MTLHSISHKLSLVEQVYGLLVKEEVLGDSPELRVYVQELFVTVRETDGAHHLLGSFTYNWLHRMYSSYSNMSGEYSFDELFSDCESGDKAAGDAHHEYHYEVYIRCIEDVLRPAYQRQPISVSDVTEVWKMIIISRSVNTESFDYNLGTGIMNLFHRVARTVRARIADVGSAMTTNRAVMQKIGELRKSMYAMHAGDDGDIRRAYADAVRLASAS